MQRKFWLVVAAVLAVEIGVLTLVYFHFSRQIAGGYGFPLDDSWIHAYFARNVAEGKGIVYNPGQHVSSTAILYTLALSAMYKISSNPIFNANALGLLLHLGTSILVFAIARKLSLRRAAALVAAMIYAAVPRLMWAALSGMEVSLYVFMATLGIYWHLRYRWYDGLKAYLATVAFALAALARPECGTFLVASIVDRLISSRRFDSDKGGVPGYAKTLPLHLLIFVVILLPALAFNKYWTGLPMPPAFYAKTGHIPEWGFIKILATGLVNVPDYLGQAALAALRDNWVVGLAMIPGFVFCVVSFRGKSRDGSEMLPISYFALPIAVAILARKGMGKSQLLFQTGRYSDYLVPMFVLIAVMGIVWLQKKTAGRHVASKLIMPAFVVAAALVFYFGDHAEARRYAEDVQTINTMQVAMGKWAAGLPKNTVLAVNDAGAIPFFSRKRIIDTVGVVNPEVFPYLKKYPPNRGGKQRGLLEYLTQRKPDYVIIFPNWYSRIAARTDILTPVKSITLKHNYTGGGKTMVVYKPKWKAN